MDGKQTKSRLKFDPNDYPLTPGLRLLEASAGTGKTFALAHLVLRLVTEGGYSISEILVVTFTEAAAAELKGRISTRLESALKGIEALGQGINEIASDEVLQQWLKSKANTESTRCYWASKLLEALENIDNADITTIHGFCKRTLRREVLNNNLSLNPVLEDESETLISEIVHDYWKKQVLALKPRDLKGVKDSGLTIESLGKNLLKVDNDPSLILEFENSYLNISETLINQFEGWVADRWAEFVSLWQQEGLELEAGLCNQAKQWRAQGIKDTKPFSPNPNKNRHEEINSWISNVNRQSKSDGLAPPSYEEIRQQVLLGNYFHPGVLSQTAQRIGEEPQSLIKPKLQKAIAALWDGPAEQVWEHSLACTLNTLNERRRELGVITYGGLLQALDPLKLNIDHNQKSPSVKSQLFESLRLRYRVTLIDEFQDTDSLQWRLLKNAFGNSSENLLLMVGDPKQAIYRFRGGDLNIYMEARSEVDRIDELLENYRTIPSLMKVMNLLMAKGLQRSSLRVPALTPRVNTQNIELSKTHNPFQLLTIPPISTGLNVNSNSIPSKSELEKIIPTAVTNIILDILKAEPNDLSPSDICILVSRHSQATSIREGLAIAGLPTRLVSHGDVLASEAAQVLQRFLDCLAKPNDSRCLRLVACSPLMQMNIEEMKTLETSGELDQLAVRFNYWSKNISHLGLLCCISELLEGQTLADLSSRSRILDDLQQCAQLVQEAMQRQGLDIISAARWLRQQRLNPIGKIPDERELHSDVVESAINVVTIHRSKGLEYRVVICPYLWEAPPIPNGPLWPLRKENRWLLALNNKWGKGKEAANEAKQAVLQEAERLAYVALTRAKDQLVVIWAKAAKQEENPLTSLLFGPDSINWSINELTTKRMNEWLNKNELQINIRPANISNIDDYWLPPPLEGELMLGAVPKRNLDISWRRNSYSSWVNDYHSVESNNLDPIGLDEGKDFDQQNKEFLINQENIKSSSDLEKTWSDQSPLGKFPRGATAGDCLHRILERIDFTKPLNEANTSKVIQEELLRAGIDVNMLNIVQDGLTYSLNTRIGGPLGELKLSQLNEKRRIHELSFDLPIAQRGRQIRPIDVAKAFQESPEARYGSSYAKKITNLDFCSRGFLTGSIDLVFTDKECVKDARWWVGDWKSNWLGEIDSEGQVIASGPRHYQEKAMEEQMIIHHYPLQAHLYLVALHRFLRWRLPNYNPNSHLGGYVYFFLRGLPGSKAMSEKPLNIKVPGLIVEQAPVERIIKLDQLLKQGAK